MAKITPSLFWDRYGVKRIPAECEKEKSTKQERTDFVADYKGLKKTRNMLFKGKGK